MAVTTKTCTSKIEVADSREGLTALDVRNWIDGIPNGAKLQAIQRDIGNQRDPYIVTVGLRATWDE